jgi:hypothetical protein
MCSGQVGDSGVFDAPPLSSLVSPDPGVAGAGAFFWMRAVVVSGSRASLSAVRRAGGESCEPETLIGYGTPSFGASRADSSQS